MGRHNDGGTIASISSVKVTGEQAVVLSCIRSSLVEVDARGVALQVPDPYLRTRETLRREGNVWRVVDHEFPDEGGVKCTYR